LKSLKRVRWAVRATLWLGLVASTVGNILHAEPNPIAQAIAAWPVAALYLTIELISRVPIHRRWLAGVRLCAAGVIAGIAAWVSYHHMAAVAARYGETGASPYLLPLSVDGLIVVASICLVELGGRIRTAEEQPLAPPEPAGPVTIIRVPYPDYERPIGPMPAPARSRSGTAGGDDSAAQRQRADERSAQQKEVVVRAVKTADPDASLRWISAATLVPVSTVRNILSAAAEQPPEKVNGKMADLEGVGAGG
jgi:hypothetical protein